MAPRARSAIASVAALTLAVACGTRVDTDTPSGSAARPSGVTTPGLASSSPGVAADPALVSPPAGAAARPSLPAAGGTGAAPGLGGTGGPNPRPGGGSAAPGGPSGAKPAVPSSGGRGSEGSGPGPAAGSPAAPAPPDAGAVPPPPSPADREPVVLGNVGTYSGPVGGNIRTILEGAQLWVKAANAKGGLNGLPVKLLVFDDGGDPARSRASVKEAVERHGVIAFLANAEVLTGTANVSYLESKRVPEIGNTLAEDHSYSSPMIFPQATAGRPLIWTTLAAAAQRLVPAGRTKIGNIACTEATLCREGQRIVTESAAALGLDEVYKGTISIAQPDFTAECLSARNAGAVALILLFDVNSVRRMSASCTRQGYQPTLVIPSGIVVDSLAAEGAFDGMIGNSTTFPFFQDNTPATAEFRRAAAAFGSGLTMGVGTATGWTAGKLLERAASSVPGRPTSASLLRGLWSIRDDDLGGLTGPLTFTENQPATASACWFTIEVRAGKWTSPDAFARHCHPWGDPRGLGYRP